jgi:hypothetical protein
MVERYSRTLPRVFVEYSNLLENWKGEVDRISKALSIKLSPDETAVCDFLTPVLHRQKCAGPITETFAYGWTSRAYAIFSDAAQDRRIDLSILDEIFDAYRVEERNFRIAFEEFQKVLKQLGRMQQDEFADGVPILRSGVDF